MVQSAAPIRARAFRYGVAIAVVAVTILLRRLLQPFVGNSFLFTALFLSMLPCARYLGMGPALAALLMGAAGSILITAERRPVNVAMFLLAGSVTIAIIEGLRRANARAEESARLADEHLEELRKESAQRAIEEQHSAQLRAIVESSEDAIISKSLNGVIESWNDGAQRIFGYTAEEVIGKPITAMIPADRASEEADLLERIRHGARVKTLETVRNHKDGRQIPVSMTVSPIHDASGKVVGASSIARDISERKKFDEQFLETQKLESLGVLAGGLAHDFNNLLTGIMGNASLVVDDEPLYSTTRRRAEDILEASERAAALVRQMLAYAGKARFMVERLDLSTLVMQIEPLLRTSIPRLVQLELRLEKYLQPIDADRSQMHQLIMNLALNAAEAMESQPGTVILSTRRRDRGGRGEVLLEVCDSGCGMDQPTLARIFDPFYTTKFTGRGLGLAAVTGIIRAHRATISVDSAPGKGSTFTVCLPAAAPAPVATGDADSEIDVRGDGAVLVVDDEEVIRNMARITLERCGYTVELASDGQAAVETFSAKPAAFQAVLLDLTMPVMDGEEALRHIQGIRPNVAVVLSSGYSEVEAVHRFQDRGLSGFLQKPYTSAALARKIKQAVRQKT